MKKLFIAIICVSLIMVGGNALAAEGYGYGPEANAEVNGVQAGASISTQSGNVYNRQFVQPGNVPMPQTNGFFTAPTPDSSFRSIKDIIRNVEGDGVFKMVISESALKSIAKGADVEGGLQVVKADRFVPRVYTKDTKKDDRWLTIAIEKPVIQDGKVIGTFPIEGLERVGTLDAEADDGDTNSFAVIADSGLDVLDEGCNYMVVTAEGAHRKVEASGWGVGTYGVYGGVSDTGKESGVGGGGFGFAKNETGPEDRPWIQGYFGVVR